MDSNNHLIQISGQYTASLQLQLAIVRAERDAAIEKVAVLEKTVEDMKTATGDKPEST